MNPAQKFIFHIFFSFFSVFFITSTAYASAYDELQGKTPFEIFGLGPISTKEQMQQLYDTMDRSELNKKWKKLCKVFSVDKVEHWKDNPNWYDDYPPFVEIGAKPSKNNPYNKGTLEVQIKILHTAHDILVTKDKEKNHAEFAAYCKYLREKKEALLTDTERLFRSTFSEICYNQNILETINLGKITPETASAIEGTLNKIVDTLQGKWKTISEDQQKKYRAQIQKLLFSSEPEKDILKNDGMPIKEELMRLFIASKAYEKIDSKNESEKIPGTLSLAFTTILSLDPSQKEELIRSRRLFQTFYAFIKEYFRDVLNRVPSSKEGHTGEKEHLWLPKEVWKKEIIDECNMINTKKTKWNISVIGIGLSALLSYYLASRKIDSNKESDLRLLAELYARHYKENASQENKNPALGEEALAIHNAVMNKMFHSERRTILQRAENNKSLAILVSLALAFTGLIVAARHTH